MFLPNCHISKSNPVRFTCHWLFYRLKRNNHCLTSRLTLSPPLPHVMINWSSMDDQWWSSIKNFLQHHEQGCACCTTLFRFNSTLLVCDQHHMEHHFLQPTQQYFRTLGVHVAGFELDLERVFPSLLRHQLRPSYSNFFARAHYVLYRPVRNQSVHLYCQQKLSAVGLHWLGESVIEGHAAQ